MYTKCFDIQNYPFIQEGLFMHLVRFSEQTAFISLNSINRVFCEEGTEFRNIKMYFGLKRVKGNWYCSLFCWRRYYFIRVDGRNVSSVFSTQYFLFDFLSSLFSCLDVFDDG